MAKIETCFICGQQVLGLVGQDQILDTYYLQNDKEDQELIAEGAFGACHLWCQIHSKWSWLWAKRIRENLRDVRGYDPVFSCDELEMLRNSVIRTTDIIRVDGWTATVSDRSLQAKVAATDGYFLPASHQLTVNITQHPDLIEELDQVLKTSKSFALLRLIDGLGLTDFLLYPEALRNGEIRPLDRGNSTIKPIISRTQDGIYITAMLSYHQYLPENIIQILLTHKGQSISLDE